MPSEVKEHIARCMSLPDIHAARLGGLGDIHEVSRTQEPNLRRDPFQIAFLSRVETVEPLWRYWMHSVSGAHAKSMRMSYTPADFCAKVVRLPVRGIDEEFLDGISEMIELRILDASRRRWSADPPLMRLPDGLVFCTQLSVLKLSRSSFVTFPACILKLSRLRELYVDYNKQLRGLPHDIGTQLRRLCVLDIHGCVSLKTLPFSLFETLEANSTHPDIDSRRLPRVPLLFSPDIFPNGYIEGFLDCKTFPKLTGWLKREDGGGVARGNDVREDEILDLDIDEDD